MCIMFMSRIKKIRKGLWLTLTSFVILLLWPILIIVWLIKKLVTKSWFDVLFLTQWSFVEFIVHECVLHFRWWPIFTLSEFVGKFINDIYLMTHFHLMTYLLWDDLHLTAALCLTPYLVIPYCFTLIWLIIIFLSNSDLLLHRWSIY